MADYKCVRCNVDMQYVPIVRMQTYGRDKLESHLVAEGYFNGQSRGPADTVSLGYSQYMCPKCGLLETHLSDSSIYQIQRYYEERRG